MSLLKTASLNRYPHYITIPDLRKVKCMDLEHVVTPDVSATLLFLSGVFRSASEALLCSSALLIFAIRRPSSVTLVTPLCVLYATVYSSYICHF